MKIVVIDLKHEISCLQMSKWVLSPKQTRFNDGNDVDLVVKIKKKMVVIF